MLSCVGLCACEREGQATSRDFKDQTCPRTLRRRRGELEWFRSDSLEADTVRIWGPRALKHLAVALGLLQDAKD